MQHQLLHKSQKTETRKEKSHEYIDELQKMNDLQGKENTILHENKKKDEIKYKK